jgi:YggT family protein
MYFISTILSAAMHVIHTVIWLYTWVIIISTLLSWVRPDPYNPIVRTLRAITEPVFWHVRRKLPFTYFNGVDLSPVVVILALQFLDYVLTRSLGILP